MSMAEEDGAEQHKGFREVDLEIEGERFPFEIRDLSGGYMDGRFMVPAQDVGRIAGLSFWDREEQYSPLYRRAKSLRREGFDCFRLSPWTMIVEGSRVKVVHRWMDGTGLAIFAVDPMSP